MKKVVKAKGGVIYCLFELERKERYLLDLNLALLAKIFCIKILLILGFSRFFFKKNYHLIMESANIHHQLQDQLVGSSSLSTNPSSYGVIGNATHAWSPPNSYLNTNGFGSYPNQENLNPREARHQENTLLTSQYNSITPDLGLIHWANNNTSGILTSNNHESAQDLYFSRIKEEMSDHYYLKYNEMLSSCPSSSTDVDLTSLKNEQRNLPYNDIGTKLFLNSFACGDLCPDSFSNGTKGRGLSHQIFPTTNISNWSQRGLTNPGSLDMNLHALDLLTSSRFSENFNSSLQNQIGLLRDGFSYGFGQTQQSHQTPLYSSNKTLAPSNGGAETKRSSNKMEQSKTLQNAQKKSRLDGHASCPPFKVRKEKLGDRIAALQQLVAPFGKTDTASVLMEAIGYIKFLQNQVETLSVPYMKASRNNARKVIKGSGGYQNESKDPNRDLKSRGLCLVPLSCLSCITDGSGATVWPPAHFNSGAKATKQFQKLSNPLFV